MLVRFWGVRGSVAAPGPATVRYGGNTSTVELRTASGSSIVLDCGTGARALGEAMAASGREARGHLLISHTHSDHLQGLPFFKPLYGPGNEWDLYAPRGSRPQIEQALAGMRHRHSPVNLDELCATLRYYELTEGEFKIDDVYVRTRYLNHAVATLAYRIEAGGVSVVYVPDHEPHASQRAWREGQDADDRPADAEDRRHLEFIAGADLLIHDAQYTAGEFPMREGFGHAAVEYVVGLAVAARVRRLALFHHDPGRTDGELDALVMTCRRRLAGIGCAPDVRCAAEGDVLELTESGESSRMAGLPTALAPSTVRSQWVTSQRARAGRPVKAEPQARAQYGTKLLICAPDARTVELIREVLRPDGFLVMATRSGHTAMEIIREQRPLLLVVDEDVADLSAAALCRTIRAEPDAALRDLPVVLLTSAAETNALETAKPWFSECLAKPFTAQHARDRLSAWLASAAVQRPASSAPS